MAAADGAIRLLAQLSVSPHKLEVLEELQSALALCSREEIASIVSDSSLRALFDCVESSREDATTVACSLLHELLGATSPLDVLRRFETELQAGLRPASPPSVRQLCLRQLKRVAHSDGDALLKSPGILTELVDLVVGGTDSAQHQEAQATLVAVASNNASCETIFKESSHVCQHFANSLQQCDSVAWFRLMQVIVDASKANEATLAACSGCGLLDALLSRLDECNRTGDVLSQLCLIDLFGDLVLTRHCYNFLQQRGVISTFYEMLRRADEDPAVALLRPGLVKLFAGFARHQPKLAYSNYLDFYVTTCCGVLSSDCDWCGLCVETLGFVGELPECKLVLKSLGPTLDTALRELGDLSTRGQKETKEKALSAVAKLIYVKTEECTTELLSLTESWFRQISHHRPLVEHLLKLSRQPFPEVRFACIRIYEAMAAVHWGQVILRDTPLFCEYLLDRGTEHDKRGKELKFDVVQQLVRSNSVADVFDAPYIQRLRLYERQGPFFVQTQAEVATEQS